ncbi:MAG: glycosyltransferase family 4 protein [Armatimonadetes bacterium]|nr:glycosyltransferase family 4 protein [Armatimonadota bacterium]
MKRRVCHVLHGPYLMDSRVRLEAEALVDAGYNVDVISIREGNRPKYEIVNGVNIYRFPLDRKRGSVIRYLWEYFTFFVLTAIFLASRPRRYCVIHVNNMPDFLVFAALLPRLFGSKVLLDVHDPMPELFQSKYGLGDKSFIVRALRSQSKWSMRFADAVMTVSDEMRKLLHSIVPDKNPTVVMNMPNSDFIGSALLPENERFRSKSEFRLLYTGTISERYGLRTVVQALPRLKERIPGISLCIVGWGEQVEELQALARELGVSEIVEFRGRVPWNEIPELIRQSDVGLSVLLKDVHTDLCFIGKVIEYVTAGLPTIVSRTRTMENYYTDDLVKFVDPGCVESFEQAVIELYENPEKMRSLSRAGIAFRDRWNWAVERAKYVELVASMC